MHFGAQESRRIKKFFSVLVFPADEITADEKEKGYSKADEHGYSDRTGIGFVCEATYRVYQYNKEDSDRSCNLDKGKFSFFTHRQLPPLTYELIVCSSGISLFLFFVFSTQMFLKSKVQVIVSSILMWLRGTVV